MNVCLKAFNFVNRKKMTTELIVTVPGRPFSLNAERSKHHYKVAEMKKYVRFSAKTMAIHEMGAIRRRPFFEKVGIDVYPYAKDRRYRQDVGNCYPTAKAIIDGLVDAGVIADDNDQHLVWLRFFPHQFGKDQMVLIVSEVE